MKRFLIPLLMSILAMTSCSGNEAANKICDFIEEATERVEKATTLKEINEINDNLTKNIAIYSLSLSEEKYKEWEEDPEANKIIEKAEIKYKSAKNARTKELTGK